MRAIAFVAIALLLLVLPTTAHAETVSWDAATTVGIPKGISGADGIKCHGEATQDGHTYLYTNYIGADAEEMQVSPVRERQWQNTECWRILQADMSGWFMANHGTILDTSRISMTIKRL